MTFDQSSSSSHRTQRARSMATDTRKSRDTVHNRNYYSHEINTLPPLPTLDTSSPFHGPPHEVDLYSRPISPPLPASPISSIDPKRETKAVQRQKKEQMVLKLQQQQQTLEKLRLERQEKIERQQAKVERKHKRNEYRQMYHDQYNYQQQMEERRAEKRQQLSLPIYTTPTFSSTSSGNSSNTLLPPTNEIYYHSSRYYHRNRPSHQSREHCQHHHHDSLSSSNSGSSFRKVDLPDEKMRSLSLKSHSTKSMYDLRHWTGAPQSPTYDYHSGYDSDDTAMSHGWDSLMDTLHSPVIPSAMSSPPIISPGSESCFKDETDMDQLDSCLNSLSLSHEDCKNGNGRYLLVLGANGRTGIEIVKQGLDRNYRVTAFVRDDKVLLEDSSLRKNQNLLIVRGSPTCQADVDRCVEGQDAVINVIGARLMSNDTTISSHSQVVLNNAMKKHGVKRLIVVTSYGCLGLRNYLISTKKLFSRMFMTGILKDKVLQEDIIQRDTTFLDWTIVRPITLKDGELSERYWVSSDELPSTSKVKVLTRRDLAHYLLSIINSPGEHHAIRSIAGKPRSEIVKQQSNMTEKKREVMWTTEPARQQQQQQQKEQGELERKQILLQAQQPPHMKVVA